MINFNGSISPRGDLKLSFQNRAFKYGDAIFDTLKYEGGHIPFIEDHYFRLMSSTRMLRMKIPMNFTLEYYKDEILKTIRANKLEDARIRVTIFRKDGGLYRPEDRNINFLMEADGLLLNNPASYKVELFKDFPVQSGLLSTIKSNNRLINVLASIFADEFNFQNCILINDNKNIVEAINANIFLIKGFNIYTPALEEGCINGVIRKKIIELIDGLENYNIYQTSISPFELLKCDEIFITNSIVHIQSITQYRKKKYEFTHTVKLKKLFESYLIESNKT
jgi:branched-chain amino acid aminotransferase